VRTLLKAIPRQISVGRISYCDDHGATLSRYFTVAAGVGADALFLSQMDAKLKRKLGYILYLWQGLCVWVTHSFPLFDAAFVEREGQAPRTEKVSQLLAVRIRDFGGVLRYLAPGATAGGLQDAQPPELSALCARGAL
jgi:diacylglycerol kinase family enzyme